jgi:hypothetical protein
MKIIYPNNITSIEADKENANYPAEYAITDHVKQRWKSTDNTGKLTIGVSAGSGVAVYGTNAETITITVRDGLTVEWMSGVEWGDGSGGGIETEWLVDNGEYVLGTYGLASSGIGALWAEYPEEDYNHIIDLEFAAAAGIEVFAGVVWAGPANEFRDPKHGIQEGIVSYDIVNELNSGATYIRSRDNVRTFDFDISVLRDTDFYSFMQDIFLRHGKKPLAWRLSDSMTNWDWAVFGRANKNMPRGIHDLPRYSKIQVSIIEEV